MKKYDVIIIGAGIGGLTAGTYLSKKGYKVLILEKHDKPGGYCSSFSRSFFKFDSGAHLLGSCNEDDSFGSLLKKLDIQTDFIRLDPTDRYVFYKDKNCPDVIEVSCDYSRFIAYLKNRFKAESKNIDRFFNEICKTNKPFLIPHIINKYRNTTYQEFLEIFFADKILMGILSAQCGFLGLPPNEVSAISAIFMLKMYTIDGAFYPRGGAQKLADSFAAKFKENGGTILFACEVIKIITQGNSVSGVLLKSKEVYEAGYVISNVDCRTTLSGLLNDYVLDKGIIDKLNSFEVGEPSFALYMGLNNKIDLQHKNGWYYPDYNINECLRELLYLHIPTNYDMSLVEKKGYQIAILYTPFNFDVKKVEDWPRKKKEVADYYIRKLDNLIPGISKNVVFMEAASPKTFERYTANTNGTAYGWKQIPSQVYLNGFPQKTSLRKLYLAGHWVMPGGGVVSVSFSGMNAARSIIKEYKRTST